MRPEILQIIASGLAGCGFGIMFHIKPRYLPLIIIGSALSWLVFLAALQLWGIRSMAMITAAIVVTIWSEIFARIVKLPVSVIYTPTIVPLIPGGNLYYCLRGFVTDSRADFLNYGGLLLEDALGIVLGSLIVLTAVSAMTARRKKM
ncbi:MAG: threonine/serine exporter family protein [Flexilinea sp.]|nr:threonine/serine exporter family protein [Flexilinea sp.]